MSRMRRPQYTAKDPQYKEYLIATHPNDLKEVLVIEDLINDTTSANIFDDTKMIQLYMQLAKTLDVGVEKLDVSAVAVSNNTAKVIYEDLVDHARKISYSDYDRVQRVAMAWLQYGPVVVESPGLKDNMVYLRKLPKR